MFTSAWIAAPTLERITGMVREREHLGGSILEFGSWEGQSTIAIAQGTSQPVIAVDHWKGNPGDKYTEPFAKSDDIYARFLQNVEQYDNIHPMVTSTEQFMDTWTKPIKFLHIDADHNYGAVKEQIEWAKSLMVSGGIMCGDDYSSNWPGVVAAVNETLPAHHVEIAMWLQEF